MLELSDVAPRSFRIVPAPSPRLSSCQLACVTWRFPFAPAEAGNPSARCKLKSGVVLVCSRDSFLAGARQCIWCSFVLRPWFFLETAFAPFFTAPPTASLHSCEPTREQILRTAGITGLLLGLLLCDWKAK